MVHDYICYLPTEASIRLQKLYRLPLGLDTTKYGLLETLNTQTGRKYQICSILDEKSNFAPEKNIFEIFAFDFRFFTLDGLVGQKYVACRQS